MIPKNIFFRESSMKSNYLLFLSSLILFLISNLGFSSSLELLEVEQERVNTVRQDQFEQLFANLEKYTDPDVYDDDLDTEIANLVNFYNLTNFIFKMLDEISKKQIPGPVISRSKDIKSTHKKYEEKLLRHELNYSKNPELLDFSNECIQKPFGRPIYDAASIMFAKKFVEIMTTISPSIRNDIQKLLGESPYNFLQNDLTGETTDLILNISFAYTEIEILKAVNQEFEVIWLSWKKNIFSKIEKSNIFLEVKTFVPSKSRANLRKSAKVEIPSNEYLRRALKIMDKLEEDDF